MSDKPTPRKTTFYWASIAGAEPEPVELVVIDGRKAVYTCGCADPFFLDDRVTKIRLGEERPAITGDQSGWVLVFGGRPGAMVRPEIASKSQEQAYKDSKRWEREALLPRHGWRGPR